MYFSLLTHVIIYTSSSPNEAKPNHFSYPSNLPIILIIPSLLTRAIPVTQTQREPTYFCLSLSPISLSLMPLSSVPFHLSLVGQFYHFNNFLTKPLIPKSSTVILIFKRKKTGLILLYIFSISIPKLPYTIATLMPKFWGGAVCGHWGII